MNKVKSIYKIQAIIVLVLIIALIACFTLGGTASADTEMSVLDLENCDKQLEERDLSASAGVIADINCIKQNKAVFDNYIKKQDGKVIIPERDNEKNILAYQLVDFSDRGVEVFPIYAYNKVDKSDIDYKEIIKNDTALISDSEKQRVMAAATDENYPDYTFFETSFCVYVKGYTGSYNNVAAIRMKLTVDYIPNDNPNFNSYIGRYEIVVSPSKKYAFKSMKMIPVVPNDIAVSTEKEGNNNQSPVETVSFGFDTGISSSKNISFGSSGYEASVGDNGNLMLKFGYSISAPSGSANVVKSADVQDYGGLHGYPITVTKAFGTDATRKGVTYTGLYYASHSIKRDAQSGGVGLMLRNLSLYGQAGEPSYKEENEDAVAIITTWEQPFHDKKTLFIATDPDGSQYFKDYFNYTDLHQIGALPGILTYGE